MDRRRSRVQYDDAEPLPIGQADAYESERWIRGQDRWTEDRRSWSQDTHNRPRERSREAQRRPSWRDRDRDRGHLPWSGRDGASGESRYHDDYERRDRWGARRSHDKESQRPQDDRRSTRERSPVPQRTANREDSREPKRYNQSKDTPLSGDTDDAEADQMAAMMGFGSFGTSKGKHVEDNSEGFAEIKKEHSWRQYMNRYVGSVVRAYWAGKEALTGLWTRFSRFVRIDCLSVQRRRVGLQDRVVSVRPARRDFVQVGLALMFLFFPIMLQERSMFLTLGAELICGQTGDLRLGQALCSEGIDAVCVHAGRKRVHIRS